MLAAVTGDEALGPIDNAVKQKDSFFYSALGPAGVSAKAKIAAETEDDKEEEEEEEKDGSFGRGSSDGDSRMLRSETTLDRAAPIGVEAEIEM